MDVAGPHTGSPLAVAQKESTDPVGAPLKESERLLTLDTLRGLALLGILLLNIEDFAGHEALANIPVGLLKPALVGWHSSLDWAIVTLNWLFAAGKMRSLFAMLFGAGVVLLTQRLEARVGSARTAAIYYRRNLWLLFFGLCHGFLIWYGDILSEYGLLALTCLYPLRRWSARTLIATGLLVWVGLGVGIRVQEWRAALEKARGSAVVIDTGAIGMSEQRSAIANKSHCRKQQAAIATERLEEERSGYLADVRTNLHEEVDWLTYLYSSWRFLDTLGALVFGMGMYKAGFFTMQWRVRHYALAVFVGYAASGTLVLMGLWHLKQSGFAPLADKLWIRIPFPIEVACATVANSSAWLLIIRAGALRWVTGPLAAVGRTALSNYLLTSVLCKWLFSWGPFKLYGQLEFYGWYVVVCLVWIVNLGLSGLWLRRFAFGPFEWLWRSLTYKKVQPLLLGR